MNPYHSLLDLVGTLARKRFVMAERYFAKIGLNHTEARMLNLLSRAGGTATQEALANQVFIDRSNVGRALKALESEQYILRCKDAADKRSNLVTITPKGEELVVEIQKIGVEMAQSFFGELTESEAETIIKMLSPAAKGEELQA